MARLKDFGVCKVRTYLGSQAITSTQNSPHYAEAVVRIEASQVIITYVPRSPCDKTLIPHELWMTFMSSSKMDLSCRDISPADFDRDEASQCCLRLRTVFRSKPRNAERSI